MTPIGGVKETVILLSLLVNIEPGRGTVGSSARQGVLVTYTDGPVSFTEVHIGVRRERHRPSERPEDTSFRFSLRFPDSENGICYRGHEWLYRRPHPLDSLTLLTSYSRQTKGV